MNRSFLYVIVDSQGVIVRIEELQAPPKIAGRSLVGSRRVLVPDEHRQKVLGSPQQYLVTRDDPFELVEKPHVRLKFSAVTFLADGVDFVTCEVEGEGEDCVISANGELLTLKAGTVYQIGPETQPNLEWRIQIRDSRYWAPAVDSVVYSVEPPE